MYIHINVDVLEVGWGCGFVCVQWILLRPRKPLMHLNKDVSMIILDDLLLSLIVAAVFFPAPPISSNIAKNVEMLALASPTHHSPVIM